MTQPDFLIIPIVVKNSPKLQPSDWIVYAVVYWYEHMRDGICTAANETIAEVAGIEARTVRVALQRLEEAGFIKRDYRDKQKKIRAQIRCLVRYSVTQEVPMDEKQEGLPGFPKARPETPAEFARRFFSGEESAVQMVLAPLDAYFETSDGKQFVEREMRKFVGHWTEPSKNGKKQKWELQQTFEVKRRLATWLTNAATWSRSGRPSKAGAGISV